MHLNKNSFSIILNEYDSSYNFNEFIYKVVLNNGKIVDKKLLIDKLLLKNYGI
jgi:hypothetical protein